MAMNFFAAQDQARGRTRLLVALFALTVLLLVVLTNLVVLIALALLSADTQTDPLLTLQTSLTPALLPWKLIGSVSLLVICVIVLVVTFREHELRQGGKVVAQALGGIRIGGSEWDSGPSDKTNPAKNPRLRQLQNIVEEMAIAAGVPVPPLYLLPEPGINAFAAGFTPADAVIGVTQGCLDLLSRDELQGVIAHEFSHILNGDMRLNIRLLALLHGILFISEAGHQLLSVRPRSSGNDKNSGILVVIGLGLSLIIIGYLGVFFGQLIKAAVSRQREFLADASAVQFTRNSQGIAGALKRIAALQQGGRVRHPHATEMSHLFFANALSPWQNGFVGWLFATHPPLKDRIKRLEPSWIGGLPTAEQAAIPGAMAAAAPVSPPPQAERSDARSDPAALTQRLLMLQGLLMAGQQVALGATTAPEQAALLPADRQAQLKQIGAEYLALSARVRHASQQLLPAQALLVCCLLSADDSGQDLSRQLKLVQGLGSPALLAEVDGLLDEVQQLSPLVRLALLQSAIPTLKQLSAAAFAGLTELCQQLIEQDGVYSTFETIVWLWLRHAVASEFSADAVSHPPRRARLAQCQDAVLSLLWLLSQQSAAAGDTVAGERAWQAGLLALGLPQRPRPTAGHDAATLRQTLDPLLPVLLNTTPTLKQQIWLAVRAAVAADGQLLLDELLWLQGLALLLEIPVDSPPPVAGF